MNSINCAEILSKKGTDIAVGGVKEQFKYFGVISFGVQEAKRSGGSYLTAWRFVGIAICGSIMPMLFKPHYSLKA